ncbi:MAG: carboxypeptidase regulatory-like domain-containing protein [bacterium]
MKLRKKNKFNLGILVLCFILTMSSVPILSLAPFEMNSSELFKEESSLSDQISLSPEEEIRSTAENFDGTSVERNIPTETLEKSSHSDKEANEMISTEELFTSALDDPTIEWKPLNKTIDFTNFNEESFLESGTDTVGYNPITNIEEIIPKEEVRAESTPESTTVEPYAGLFSEPGPESVIGTDDRARIYSTSSYPWRTVCKVYITFPSGNNYMGSAMIIDNYHILTAGHVVYDSSEGGWASSLEIVPGQDNGRDGIWPYHHAWVTFMRSYTGWTNSGDHNHDWAMCTLDRNIGAYTGWMGRKTADKSDPVYVGGLNIAGYPGDLDEGENMYYDFDSGDKALDYTHWYHMDTAGGMSGGPVWELDGLSRFILSIHAYGTGVSWTTNHGTRLNNDKYNRIFDWQAADTAPTDKPDLRDRGSAYRSVSDTNVVAGVDSLTINCDVENVGTATASGFYVDFFASTNNYISTSDYLLGWDYIDSSVSSFSYVDASWSGTIRDDIPEGDYYIGWIIDRFDSEDEFDESNNKAYYSSTIHIEGPPPPSGYIELTVQDSATVNPLSTAYVYVENSTGSFIDEGNTNSMGFYNITNLPVDTYDIYVSKVGYYSDMVSQTIDYEGDDDYRTVNLEPKPRDSGYIEVTARDSDTWDYISNAHVEVINMTSNTTIDTGSTDFNGFYNATGLTTGDWFEVQVSKAAYEPQSQQAYMNWNGDDDYLYFYLQEEIIQDDNYEENDDYTTAYNLSSYEGTWLSSINGSGVQLDEDWYEIYVDPGELYLNIDVIFNHSDGNIDIGIYNGSLTWLGWASSTTDNESLNLILPQGGTYYIKVHWGNAGNTYDLKWKTSVIPPDDNYEENDVYTSSFNLTTHEGVWLSSVNGSGIQLDYDWYEIYADANDYLYIETTFTHSEGNIDIVLTNDSMILLGYSWSMTDDEIINIQVTSPGTYYFVVYGENKGNSYDLKWESSSTDTNPPTWNPDPTDQTINIGDYFSYTVDSFDPSGISSYWIDDTTNFAIDSINGLITNATALSVGIYPLTISVNDTKGNINTATIEVTVLDPSDTTAPTWDQLPMDQIIDVGEAFSYDVNASDPSGIGSYGVNDTTNFAIDSYGIITNATALAVGEYWLEISASDINGNTNTTTIKVTVQDVDTTDPTWDPTPSDQTITVGDPFSYDVDATDANGIDYYWINDTTNFAIDSNGTITNATVLTEGVYSLEIRAYDPEGNFVSAVISITVEAEEPPAIPGYELSVILVIMCISVMAILISKRKKV